MQSSEETNNFPFLPCTVGLSPTKEATDDSATSIDDFTQDNLTPIPCNMTLREDENQSLHPTDNNHSRFQEQGDYKNSKKTKLKRKKKDKNLDLVLQDASKENPIREESNLEGDITVISDEEEENGGAEMRIVIDSVYSLAPNSPTADQVNFNLIFLKSFSVNYPLRRKRGRRVYRIYSFLFSFLVSHNSLFFWAKSFSTLIKRHNFRPSFKTFKPSELTSFKLSLVSHSFWGT